MVFAWENDLLFSSLPTTNFIESLYELADTCQFGTLKEELIRDRIVVGIRNAVLSQKLMQDDTLTLEKAVKQAKSSELVKEHHEILKGLFSFKPFTSKYQLIDLQDRYMCTVRKLFW